jgi:L-ascorbate metabolism protein UlaG (beta-lactamase superfamily)
MTNPNKNTVRVGLVGHAGILIQTSRQKILCDPWLFGYAFNGIVEPVEPCY